MDKWGIVDTEEAKYLINFPLWGTPQSAVPKRAAITSAAVTNTVNNPDPTSTYSQFKCST